MTMVSIWIRILAPARLKVAAAGHSTPSISDFKLEKRLCVTRGADQRSTWWIGRLGDWWSKGSGQEKLCHTMSISGCLPLMHSYTRGKKCALSTLDMSILLFVGQTCSQHHHDPYPSCCSTTAKEDREQGHLIISPFRLCSMVNVFVPVSKHKHTGACIYNLSHQP